MRFLIFLLLFLIASPSLAQSNLNQQLQNAVSEKDWATALEIVDQLMESNPEKKAELEAYREKIESLQTGSSPSNDQGSTAASSESTAEESQEGESLVAKIKIMDVDATVGSTRIEQYQEDVEFVYVNRPGQPLARIDQRTTDVYKPETYLVTVKLSGPVGISPKDAVVRATLTGGGEETEETTVTFGTRGIFEAEFRFASASVEAPSNVEVEVIGGETKTMKVNLPTRNQGILYD
jgi:hypothetical protein